MNKEWLHFDRFSDEYKEGALNFVNAARGCVRNLDIIVCPCMTCRNLQRHHFKLVYEHLVIKGMDPSYTTWVFHGESPSESVQYAEEEMAQAYRLYHDFLIQHKDIEGNPCETREEKIVNLVRDAETPLFFGCTKYTKMSAIVALFKFKATYGLTDTGFDEMLQIFGDMLPDNNTLPSSFHETKKIFKSFELGYEKIHACVNDCCLFRHDLELVEECPKCGASRWKVNERSSKIEKGVPAKVLRYFPIIPRLRRMYAITDTVEQLKWHSTHKSQDSKMRHPVDSLAWDRIDKKWPSFASDARNIRFGLCTDGFNPFQDLRNKYSCWPVILTTYNLLPWLCLSKDNLMLTLIIPGPKQLGNDIDVYLAPLIDDLKELWTKGVEVYDAFSKETFNLKAVLMWTINDFSAYGNLSGWPYKGRFACPICHKDTCANWLKHSHKFSYMGHRQFLPSNHRYRKKMSWFNGHHEDRSRPKISTGEEIFLEVNGIVYNWGKKMREKIEKKKKNVKQKKDMKEKKVGIRSKKAKKKQQGTIERNGKNADHKKRKSCMEEMEDTNSPNLVWKKKSIFFELPYWKSLLVRYNLDVMHTEKNICESIIGTLLFIKGKSKDGLKSRKDLEEMGIRKDLHPKKRGKHFYLRAAPHTLSKIEKEIFCWRLANVKLPDGYGSNIGKCTSLEDNKMFGLKSHDYHILMQQLLSMALRGLLPKGPRTAIFRLCSFFNELCQRVIDRNKMEKLEEDIVETLCMLERYFPPSFFDIMVHLTIHIGREARLCGPVQYRWMYPFERFMKVLKRYVMNRARPEGCMAERYLAEEFALLCSKYIKQASNIGSKNPCNEDDESGLLLEGRPISQGKHITLTNEMLQVAHRQVLFNMA